MYYHGYGAGVGGMVVMALIVLGVAGLIAAAVASGPRPPMAGPDGALPRTGAERVLAERFARGEIDAEEYEDRMRTLRAGRP